MASSGVVPGLRDDRIGTVYGRHRRPDPRIAAQIGRALGRAGRVVNIGAGTDSYEPADRAVVAVEPSEVMIGQRPAGSAPVVRGRAEALPFGPGSFDAALAFFTVHHWSDPDAGLAEMSRVAGRVVIFSFDPVVHGRFWLIEDYVPEAFAPESTSTLSPEAVAAAVGADRIEVVPVPADCVDGFNWAYWCRPEAYLDPEVRACISGLALLDDEMVAGRMATLAADLADGTWEARHGELRSRESIDGGLRLVIRDEVRFEEIDLTDLDRFVAGFPDEVFRFLRAEAPVWWHPKTEHTPGEVGFWVVSGHAEVLEVVSDVDCFSSAGAPGAAGGGTLIEDLPFGFAAGVLLNMMDDPRHQRIRRLVTPAVAPRALALLEGELRSRTVAILEAVAPRGSCDFLMEVAVELPLQATATLMGVPHEDRHALMAWSGASLTYDDRELGTTTSAVQEASAAMAAYGSALIERKRREGGEDILATVATAVIEGEAGEPEALSDLELLMFFNLLMAAGSETTRNAIALGLAAFIEHPHQWKALQADPTLVSSAVEEILRWSSATLYNRRTATGDVEVAGAQIRAGDKVTLWWASANRDEAVFADPFRFDIGRSPNPHLAFGYRSHFCLGANLARMEVRIMLEELLARFDHFAFAGPIERFRTNKHAGVKRMPVTFRPR